MNVVGVLEEGFEVLSCEVSVQGGCCIVSGRVVVGVPEVRSRFSSCKRCVRSGSCLVSGGDILRVQ